MRKISFIVLGLIYLIVASGCSPKSVAEIQEELAEENSGKVRLSELRPTPPKFDVHQVVIQREKFQRSFNTSSGAPGRTGFDIARVVRVFERSATAAPYPVHRVFQVIPDSPFAQLGIKSGDVVVGADDCIIVSGVAFKQYVSLLQWEKQAEIELRREGKPILIQAKFVD